jgi:non-canonical purine NTP pyrophosphatase (RdgB/HAM1 family)
MEILFVTSNKVKREEFNNYFKDKCLKLTYIDDEVDEIQSLNLEEVVKDKAMKLKKHIVKDNQILVVDDTSIELDCLNGFPGTFIKYFLSSISLGGIIDILDKYDNRKISYVCGFGIIFKDNFYYLTERLDYHAYEKKDISKENLKQNISWSPMLNSGIITPRNSVCEKLLLLIKKLR